MSRTINDAKFLVEESESLGVRIWEIRHKEDVFLRRSNRERVYYHWYDLAFSSGPKVNNIERPFRDEFFNSIQDGEYPGVRIVFDDKEILALKIKYSF